MDNDRDRIQEALPQYALQRELGRGAFGVVWQATHRVLGRAVAIKQLPAHVAEDASIKERFLIEARLAASFAHPHIVPVHDFYERDGLYLLVMEHLGGGTLKQRIQRGGIGADGACGYVLAICSALGYAHERGVLHRDVKPDNVMFAADGTAKLTDFGLAKLQDSTARLTLAGAVMGTPMYMAPEQALGQPVTPATDVFATAVLLYELLSGQLPYEVSRDGVSVMALLVKRAGEPARPLAVAAPDAPAAIAAVVDRALAREAEDRYQSGTALGVALAEAATSAYGPGWLRQSGVSVMGSPSIVAAAERPSSGRQHTAIASPVAPERRSLEATPSRAEAPRTEVLAAPGSPPGRSRRALIAVTLGALILVATAALFAVTRRDGAPTVAASPSDSSKRSSSSAVPATAPLAAFTRPNERAVVELCRARPELFADAPDPDARCVCIYDIGRSTFGSTLTGAEAQEVMRNQGLTADTVLARIVQACRSAGR